MRVVRVRTVVYLRYNGRMTVRLIQRILEVNVFIIRRREESPEVVPREAHATDLEDAVVFPIIMSQSRHMPFSTRLIRASTASSSTPGTDRNGHE